MTSYYPPQFSYNKFNPSNFLTDANIEDHIVAQKTKTSKFSISGSNTVISSDLVPNHDSTHRLGLSENNTFELYGNKFVINGGTTDTSTRSDNIGINTSVDSINQAIYFNTDLRNMYIGQAYQNGTNSNNGFTMAISGGSGNNPKLNVLFQKDGTVYFRTNLNNDDILPNVDGGFVAGNGFFRWDDVYASNGTINTSDERQKKDITSLDTEKTIEFIKSLRPVRYKLKNHKRFHCGLIYQELEQNVDAFLKEWGLLNNEDDKLGVRYDELLSVLVKTYQYLIEKNEELKKRLFILSK